MIFVDDMELIDKSREDFNQKLKSWRSTLESKSIWISSNTIE